MRRLILKRDESSLFFIVIKETRQTGLIFQDSFGRFFLLNSDDSCFDLLGLQSLSFGDVELT